MGLAEGKPGFAHDHVGEVARGAPAIGNQLPHAVFVNDQRIDHARAEVEHALGRVESIVDLGEGAHRLIAGPFRAIRG